MKRIVAVVDAVHFKEEQLDSFQYVTWLLEGSLKILLLENETSRAMRAGQQPEDMWLAPAQIPPADLELLEEECRERGIQTVWHRGRGIALKEVVRESRFADLLLIDRNTSLSNLFPADVPGFIKDVPADAQCPVLVLPEGADRFREVVFTYNGSYSSVYAMKKFLQLFPRLGHDKATVVYVPEKGIPIVPNEQLLKEYLQLYFTEVDFVVLQGLPEVEIRKFLLGKKDIVAVMGAYGRNTFSRFFNPGNTRSLLRNIDLPVFITHP
ncbi:universal stress protein [Chitinophaga alhagiae]|uniref:universal stress protein n=1 Tax=Chitinophaga alhagiae TaxID=2203219 RepID=UPI000E5AE48E|nr:universal stress protein [Chitinophaga alhagiae]